MRECPKCHYIDPPNWRCPPFGPDFDYMRLDEFKELMPELGEELGNKGRMSAGKVVYDELHAYRCSGKYVYRVWLPIWKAYGGESRPWAEVRRTKMYDSAGRLDKKAWAHMLKIMGARVGHKTEPSAKLDLFLSQNALSEKAAAGEHGSAADHSSQSSP